MLEQASTSEMILGKEGVARSERTRGSNREGFDSGNLGVGVWDEWGQNPDDVAAATGRLAILGSDFGQLMDLAVGAQSAAVQVLTSSHARAALWDVICYPQAWAGVLVMTEDFGSISATFNLFHSFRLRCPSVPVIMASPHFTRDDYTSERLPLCDLSLKLPTNLSNLGLVMYVAEVNNRIWYERTRDLKNGLL